MGVENDELTHYGVKGMKWGVRKAQSGRIKARATMTRKDLKDHTWMRAAKTDTYDKVYRRAAGKIRKGTRQINKDPRFKDQDFRRDSPLRRQYYGEYSKMVTDQLNAASAKRGISPNKRYQLHFNFDVSVDAKPQVSIRQTDTRVGRREERKAARETRKLRHADEQTGEELLVELVYDKMGYILDLVIPGGLKHDAMEDALFHYGVKGMRWGVRKDDSDRVEKKKTRSERKADKAAAAEERRKAAAAKKAEADRVAEQRRAETTPIARRSSQKPKPMDSLTDKEIKAAVSRLELETKYSELMKKNDPMYQRMIDAGKTGVIKATESFVANKTTHLYNTGVTKAVKKIDLELEVSKRRVKYKGFRSKSSVRKEVILDRSIEAANKAGKK